MRTASCTCGQLTLTTTADPVRVSICHCLACQRRTGSVFGAQARFPADAVTIRGTSKQYVRSGDSGGRATFHFCPECGTTAFWYPSRKPDMVAVALGCFADPKFPPG